jgi:RecB family endonuclease NucS
MTKRIGWDVTSRFGRAGGSLRSVRLIMVKADGCVAIHADGGAYKPLNWMNAPNRLAIDDDGWTVTSPKGETLRIHIHEVISDTDHEMGIDPGRSAPARTSGRRT